ncbi:ParB/Srx family N-terminal domain-containing protein [Bradyrhizobium sp. CER78]|uniref:ParB/Srx family N-terminal domain-containing protein n=1 Tax=Bradyrhizobium sp. CER78 TaxID=3039162 RepID=UPI002448195A|nr:ParB/Srx family N-terminal domain-containing protein [Bradyrhizobium sp. CER78]MDH2381449.1 ParB/Srx family N-terminal domain-containing protein [Bradyrhizobium sp. CER78]
MFVALSTRRFASPSSEFSPGPAPILNWVSIEKLVVDVTYQREIGRRGAANVTQIAENFDWSKFAPVIVAPVEGGFFAIVDGQHRTTAAMLRGQEQVPCQIVQADRAQQAAAYAAVNGNVTKTTAQQLYHAKLAAKDEEALALAEVCAAAGVEILRKNLVRAAIQRGQTYSVTSLIRCFNKYGRNTLITALQCITETADGNPGFVRGTFIEPLCEVLHEAPQWRDAGEALLRAMDKFKFADAWGEIAAGRDQIFPATAKKMMADKIRKFLLRRLGSSVTKAA